MEFPLCCVDFDAARGVIASTEMVTMGSLMSGGMLDTCGSAARGGTFPMIV
jgi:hypothetical protein